MKKLLKDIFTIRFLASLLIPIIIIASSVNTWGERIALNLITQINNLGSSFSVEISMNNGQLVNLTKPEPSIPWLSLLISLLGYYLIYWVVMRKFINDKIELMDSEDKKSSILFVMVKIIKSFKTLIFVYAILDNLGANYQTPYLLLNALNWLAVSVVIGEVFRFIETIKYESKKRT